MPLVPTLLASGAVDGVVSFETATVTPTAGVVLELDVFSMAMEPPAVSSVTGLGLTWARLDDPSSAAYNPIQRWAAVIPRGGSAPSPGTIEFEHDGASGVIVFQLKAWTGFLGSTIDQAYRNFEEPYSGVRYATKSEETFDVSGYPGPMYRAADRASVAFAGLFSDSPTENASGYTSLSRTQEGNVVLVSGTGDEAATTLTPAWSDATGFIRRGIYSELRAELFVEELFDYTPGPLDGQDGGTGWAHEWLTADDRTDVGIVTAGSLEIENLSGATTGNKLSGTGSYTIAGRRIFHRTEQLPVVYCAVTVAREISATSIVLYLSPGAFEVAPPSDSIAFGIDIWTDSTQLSIWQDSTRDGTGIAMPSDGTPVLLVAKVEWDGEDAFTASLFVDPTPGAPEPGSPDAQITGTNTGLRNLSLYLSDYTTPVIHFDTVRFGEEWSQVTAASVAPTIHDLEATSLATEAPTLGSPALDQPLSALSVSAGTPALGTPALIQLHLLAASGLAAGTPTLGSPSLTERPALTAVSLATGTPTLSTATLAQRHGLTATDILVGTPMLGTPALDPPPATAPPTFTIAWSPARPPVTARFSR